MALPAETTGGGPLPPRAGAPQSSDPQVRTIWNEELGVYFVYEWNPYTKTWEPSGSMEPAGARRGGGSGYIPPDHFFDLSPMDEWEQGQREREFEANEKYRQAVLDLERAKVTGDLELAKQAQADMNYWEGVKANLEQERNAITVGGQKVDWALGQLNSETQRRIAEQANATGQFGAETTRAGTMGALAQAQNELIAKMASDPRDLFGLYFMQRGVTPNWDSLKAGQPMQGSALVPQNALTAYTPTTAAPRVGEGTLSGSDVQAPEFLDVPRGTDFNARRPLATGGVTTRPAVVGDDPRGRDRSREEVITPVMTPSGPGVHVQPINPDGLRAQREMRLRMMAGMMPRDGGSRGAMPRYAVGTDNSAAYGQAGFGAQWIPSSQNTHLGGQQLPPNLQMLKDYGVPLPPDLVAAATGRPLAPPNTASVLAQRGIGTAPSLQGLRNMDPNLRKTYESYVQGVGGVPFDSLTSFLQMLTGQLQRARRAQMVT